MHSDFNRTDRVIMSPRLAFAMLILMVLSAAGCASRSRQSENITAGGALPGKDDCIWVLYVDRWVTIDTSTLLVYTANNNYFLVKVAQPVPNLNDHDAVAFYSSNHDDRVCGNGSDLLVRTTDAVRDPIVTIRSIKASLAKQYQKMVTPTTASAAGATNRPARRRNAAPASTSAQPTDTTDTPAQPAGTAQPTDTTTQPTGTATPPAGTTAQPAAGP
jgi:Family of unknown function (DUF6491)